jgi:hypothetical protein
MLDMVIIVYKVNVDDAVFKLLKSSIVNKLDALNKPYKSSFQNKSDA